jgi:N-methylhydantoinase B
VARDVRWGKVSRAAAAAEYGVLIEGPDDDPTVARPATDRRRADLREARTGTQPFFDRGPGYARLSGGRPAAEVDYR